MTSLPERKALIELIQQAQAKGARLERACNEAGICLRTYRRWFKNGKIQADQRPTAVRPAPTNKLTTQERMQILELCNSPQYSQLPPTQIVPDLLVDRQLLCPIYRQLDWPFFLFCRSIFSSAVFRL